MHTYHGRAPYKPPLSGLTERELPYLSPYFSGQLWSPLLLPTTADVRYSYPPSRVQLGVSTANFWFSTLISRSPILIPRPLPNDTTNPGHRSAWIPSTWSWIPSICSWSPSAFPGAHRAEPFISLQLPWQQWLPSAIWNPTPYGHAYPVRNASYELRHQYPQSITKPLAATEYLRFFRFPTTYRRR